MNEQLKSYSYSSLSGFDNCPKAFEFRYIKKLPEAFKSVEAFMGSIVHLVLENIYQKIKDNESVEVNSLAEIYRKYWDESDKTRVKVIVDGKAIQDYLDLGLELLTSYYENVFKDDISETLMLEHKFEIKLSEDRVFKGVIDRVSRTQDGTLRITDFKTGRVGEPKDTLQLPSYSIYIYENNMDNEIEICYEDLKNSKTKVARVKREEIKVYISKIEKKIEIIENSEGFPAKPSSLCRWCGYNDICEEYMSMTGEEGNGTNYCPECGSLLVKRKGKFGSFLGCSNYPECRYTFNLGEKKEELSGDLICPECGSPLREMKGKFGKFLGCSNYPECRFTRKIK